MEQYFVQVVDDANNVSVSSKKGQDFEAPAAPISESAPTITVLGTPVNNEYVGPQTVAITGQGTLTYTVGSGAPTAYTGPFVVAGAGSHTITATSPGGTATLTFSIIGAPGPSVSISSPSAATSYVEGQDIPAVFSCVGYGTVTCTASPAKPDNTLGTHVFTVNAVDGAGKTASASVTYVVRQSAFRGLLEPVDDGPGTTASVFKKGSTIPLKFQVVTSNGAPVSDAQAAAVVAGCGVMLAYGAAGSMSAPVDESVATTTPDSGTCFKYDAATDQFIFNLGTKGLTSGQWYLLRIHFVTAGIPDHTVKIGIR